MSLPTQALVEQSAPPLTAAARRFTAYAGLTILIVAAVGVLLFFRFSAEDAFITYRYAENLVNLGSLVYNVGEPINALTSPLHALLSAALYRATGNTIVSNKVVALLLLFISALIVWRRFEKRRPLQFLALGLMLLPPSILLWTFGGLETPFLLFFVTMTVILAERGPRLEPLTPGAIFLLAGLTFLTRYDSALFFLPLLAHVASKARAPRRVLFALAVAAILPSAWIAISFTFYGDPLPTSFYVKTPRVGLGAFYYNGIYIASHLLFVGLIPTLVLVPLLLRSLKGTLRLLSRHVRRLWWLYLGLALQLLYGLTMATHHMMFSFRFFVPFIPAAVILVVDLIASAVDAEGLELSSPQVAAPLAGFLVLLSLFQLFQIFYTYNGSLNGISPLGEYQALGVRDYVSFLHTLEQEAVDIEAHWKLVNGEIARPPRIITYAAGVLPYKFRDAYIYEQLVSYRHCHQRYQQGRHADYLHILAPRLGSIEEQLPDPPHNYALVSSYEMIFDGSQQSFLVYYNPAPESHNLSPGINGLCRSAQ